MIARLALKPSATDRHLGDVTLAQHQIDAVSRIESAFAEFGGAFLCDIAGSGKTYIGLAVAAAGRAAIIAPASLREMWREALRRTGMCARFFSVESLSRGCPDVGAARILIVDEAHHFRNAATIRHRALAQLISGRRILLMTATPIHNSRADLESLASLFLGSRASRLSESELGRIIVRRNKTCVNRSAPIPEVSGTRWLPTSDEPRLVGKVMALPAAVPARDAGEARALASLGLLRQWASSEAALRAALKRRLARAAALESSLVAGDYPSEMELRSWITGDDSIQLGIPGFFESPARGTPADTREILSAVAAHCDGLRSLMSAMKGTSLLDTERARQLLRIADSHRGERIVAFTSYEATVLALFKLIARRVRSAALTANGGLVAGGRISRQEIIDQFDPCGAVPPASDRIDLLITTDLLSEGVNLQQASVVVHLDLPWTQARIDQRVGRVARVGSRNHRVIVYGFRPPSSADAILRMSALIENKARDARAALGRDNLSAAPRDPGSTPAPPESQEGVRGILGSWISHDESTSHRDEIVVASVTAPDVGFLAIVEIASGHVMVSALDGNVSDQPADIERACRNACGSNTDADLRDAAAALEKIGRWVTRRKAADLAGIGSSGFLSTRRRILRRIDSLAAHTPPHRRSRCAQLFQNARLAATAPHGAAAESELLSLAADVIEIDDAWLTRVANVGDQRKRTGACGDYKVRALLLFAPSTPPAGP